MEWSSFALSDLNCTGHHGAVNAAEVRIGAGLAEGEIEAAAIRECAAVKNASGSGWGPACDRMLVGSLMAPDDEPANRDLDHGRIEEIVPDGHQIFDRLRRIIAAPTRYN
jgi:hypothetical protein